MWWGSSSHRIFKKTSFDGNKRLAIPFNLQLCTSCFITRDYTVAPRNQVKNKNKACYTEGTKKGKGTCLKAPILVSHPLPTSHPTDNRRHSEHCCIGKAPPFLSLVLCLPRMELMPLVHRLWLLPSNPIMLELGSLEAPYPIPGKEEVEEETQQGWSRRATGEIICAKEGHKGKLF